MCIIVCTCYKVFRILISLHIRICLQKCIRVRCCIQTALCKICIVFCIEYRCLCHNSREISRCCIGNRRKHHIIRLINRKYRLREYKCGYFMVDATACCILHLEHPVKLILCFIEKIRCLVSALWNSKIIGSLTIILVSKEEILYRLSTRHNISSVITGIMPSTRYINLCSRCISVNSRFLHMTCLMCEISSDILCHLCSASLLV